MNTPGEVAEPQRKVVESHRKIAESDVKLDAGAVAVAHGKFGNAHEELEAVAHLTPEPTAHSDRIGEGFGFPLNADGSVPGTNHMISMTITAACTTYDIIPTFDQGNRMSCHAGNRMSQVSCTQSSTTKPGYYDFTNFAAIIACGSTAWVESFQLYSKFQLWFAHIGHTADLSLVGRVPNWNGNVGKPCHGQCVRCAIIMC